MTVGDPKKAFVLSAVAILALAFLGFRILPRAEKAVTQMLVDSGTHAAVPINTGGYPQTVYMDPFSHPALKVEAAPAMSSSPTATTVSQGTPAQPLPSALEGQSWSGLEPVQVEPEEITSNSQQQEVKPSAEITLEAILRVENKPMAFLKADKGTGDKGSEPESKMYKPGQKVLDAVIVSISESQVVLKVKERRLTLRVGEFTKL